MESTNPGGDAVRDAVEGVYSVFSTYRLPGRIDGCPCCIGTVPRERLHAVPLRLLTPDDLGRYAAKALTTIGSVADLKHFLPRILELTAEDPSWSIGPEVTLGKLRLAEWLTWPEKEVRAVRSVLLAWWRQLLGELSAPVAPDTAEDRLCAIAQAEDDLSPYLDEWRGRRDPAAVGHLLELLASSAPRSLSNVFWAGRMDQQRQVVEWVSDAQTGALLEEAFFALAGQPAAEEVSFALEQWRSWR